MEEERIERPDEENPYSPRPRWQVWAARVALVIFIFVLIMYYFNIFRGGM